MKPGVGRLAGERPVPHDAWHRRGVTALRQLRRDAALSQRELANLLEVPVNTIRMWDSGLRIEPAGLRRISVYGRFSDVAFAPPHAPAGDEFIAKHYRLTCYVCRAEAFTFQPNGRRRLSRRAFSP